VSVRDAGRFTVPDHDTPLAWAAGYFWMGGRSPRSKSRIHGVMNMKPTKSALSLALLVALTGTATAHPNGGGHRSGPERRILALVDQYFEVVNDQDLGRFPEVFAADYLLDSTAGTYTGLPTFTGLMSALYSALPDIHYTLDEVLVDGNAAVIRYHYTGTNLGSFLGLPATGDVITCRGLEIDRFEDGLMVESRNFTDYYCLLSSLGAL
jgi:predicted ester cyclase